MLNLTKVTKKLWASKLFFKERILMQWFRKASYATASTMLLYYICYIYIYHYVTNFGITKYEELNHILSYCWVLIADAVLFNPYPFYRHINPNHRIVIPLMSVFSPQGFWTMYVVVEWVVQLLNHRFIKMYLY